MKITTTYPAFKVDIEDSFREVLGNDTKIKLIETYEDIEESDLIVFPGGEDVNPAM